MSRPIQYCPNCGASIVKGTKFCAECGTQVPISYSPPRTGTGYQPPPSRSYPAEPRGYIPPAYQVIDREKGIHPLLAIAIVILPLIGLVTFFVYREKQPKASEQSCYAAIIGMIINFFLSFMFL